MPEHGVLPPLFQSLTSREVAIPCTIIPWLVLLHPLPLGVWWRRGRGAAEVEHVPVPGRQGHHTADGRHRQHVAPSEPPLRSGDPAVLVREVRVEYGEALGVVTGRLSVVSQPGRQLGTRGFVHRLPFSWLEDELLVLQVHVHCSATTAGDRSLISEVE